MLRARKSLGGYASIVYDAAGEPMRQMARNAGESPDVILDKVRRAKGNRGWDFKKGQMINLVDAGIIDPTKVARIALQNAASIAGLMLTTEALVSEVPDDKRVQAC